MRFGGCGVVVVTTCVEGLHSVVALLILLDEQAPVSRAKTTTTASSAFSLDWLLPRRDQRDALRQMRLYSPAPTATPLTDSAKTVLNLVINNPTTP